ncbi:MAG: S8 family peptidase [Candidatus Marithrix sp.]
MNKKIILFILALSFATTGIKADVWESCEENSVTNIEIASFKSGKAIKGQWFVGLKEGCTEKSTRRVRKKNNIQLLKRFSVINAELWQTNELSEEIEQGLIAVVEDSIGTVYLDPKNPKLGQYPDLYPCVDYIEPNYIVKAQKTPNDVDFSLLWGLNKIQATKAWDINVSSNDIVIAVIDTGVDYTHPDLVDNMWKNLDEIPNNGIDDDNNGYINDIYGYDFVNKDNDPQDDGIHGTHCAGTIAAIGNNNTGVVGVNWSAKIMAVKTLVPNGNSAISAVVCGMKYAAENGAKIVNASLGTSSYSQALYDAVEKLKEDGILYVASAGNYGLNNDKMPNYPASYDLDNIISVAATGCNDDFSKFLNSFSSNYGATTVDLGAPGSSIFSTIPVHMGSYAPLDGTSMAAPHM